MARFGIASRRVSEEMIEAGRVKIGDRVAVLGNRVSSTDVVLIDEVPLLRDSSLVHYLLNKPVGVISTSKDPSGRPTVVGLVPQIERVFPVGRLDSESEG
ncbi:MAG TPA: MFS transporter, partial [Acidimicrobiaceae bacterium]|nr:MFS transporter [Acidimicrobiaceae bacterium]